ncbi:MULTISPECIES: MerR family transcriptional regulator [Luteimonas]|uniref:MerR family transcriptional regulator n=1 Tax=Luteimonas notoginsengisoli TaxID=1578200 RepID=A0ABV7UWK7_9GAMM
MTISRLAAAAGVHVETVRYYQRRGLLPEPKRPMGSVRRYGPDDVGRLQFVPGHRRWGSVSTRLRGCWRSKVSAPANRLAT